MEHYDDIVWQDAKGITCGKVKEAFDMAMDALKNPWHKVSEELPKEDGVYLVKYSIGNYPITYPIVILYESGEWKNVRLEDGAVAITHWMEIPEIKED